MNAASSNDTIVAIASGAAKGVKGKTEAVQMAKALIMLTGAAALL